MNATALEKSIYGDNIEVVSRERDCTIYRLTDSVEETIMTSYAVFPGIELVYRDIHSPTCLVRRSNADLILEISHCREGRMEYEMEDNYFYLSPGDISLLHRHDTEYTALFPLHHYHGISVIIDLERTPKCLSCFLEDVIVSPHALADKFCTAHPCYVARSSPGIEHIFSELYHVPETVKRGYFKVKVLELMLFLTALDTGTDESEKRCCSRSQVLLAREVCAYLSGHISDKITLEQLSEIFHVSGTSIRNSFRAVYGESVYSHIRTQKMQMAAQMLLQSDGTVLDIAGQVGYENASKFSGAFRDVMGMTPNEYRIRERKKHIPDL